MGFVSLGDTPKIYVQGELVLLAQQELTQQFSTLFIPGGCIIMLSWCADGYCHMMIKAVSYCVYSETWMAYA